MSVIVCNTDVRGCVERSQENAIRKSELEKLKDEHDAIIQAYLRNDLPDGEYQQQLKTNNEASGAGMLLFDSIVKFSNALKLLLDDSKEVEGILEHENQHLSKALELGLDGCYAIQFIKSDIEDRVDFYPSSNIDFPGAVSAEEKKRMLIEIIGAAHELSARDKTQLGIES